MCAQLCDVGTVVNCGVSVCSGDAMGGQCVVICCDVGQCVLSWCVESQVVLSLCDVGSVCEQLVRGVSVCSVDV